MARGISIILLLSFMAGLYVSQAHLELTRTRSDISSRFVVENVPPVVALCSMALGGFRTLFVNILWLRALDLQEQKNFFEMMQLSDWIANLQPHLTNTWKFQIWNIAYNIVSEFPKPEDKYRWLKKAIQLLRDKGLAYNPDSAELYKELGLLFQLRMTLDQDEYHMYYKREWAFEMIKLFQGYHPDYAGFKAIPDTVKDLTQDREVSLFLEEISEQRVDLFNDYFPIIERKINLSQESKRLIEVHSEAFRKVSLFVRKQELKGRYKLDALLMEEMDKRYGPLDWTLTYAHAAYWAFKALECIPQGDIQTERVLYQSLQLGVYNGRLVVEEDGSIFIVPNPAIIPKLKHYYQDLEIRYGREVMAAPFRYFLIDAIPLLYLYGEEEEASVFYTFLQEHFLKTDSAPSLQEFVIESLKDEAKSDPKASHFIPYLIRQGFWWLALEERQYAQGFFALAQSLYAKEEGESKMPFPVLREDVLESCLGGDFPLILKEKLKKFA